MHPVVELSRKGYEKGMALRKARDAGGCIPEARSSIARARHLGQPGVTILKK
jgi:hypothetical protein